MQPTVVEMHPVVAMQSMVVATPLLVSFQLQHTHGLHTVLEPLRNVRVWEEGCSAVNSDPQGSTMVLCVEFLVRHAESAGSIAGTDLLCTGERVG